MKNNDTQIVVSNLALEYNSSNYYCLNTVESKKYLEEIEINDLLPFSNIKINFSSDLWDFSTNARLNISRSKLRFDFSGFPSTYKTLAKEYAFISLINDKLKIQTISKNLQHLKKWFVFFQSNNILNIEDINIKNIEAYSSYLINITKVNKDTVYRYQRILIEFLSFYHINISNLKDTNIFNYLDISEYKTSDAWKESHKAKKIPNWYYNKMLSGLIHYMNDDSCPYWIKGPASIYVLLSQVGLRACEILSLSCDCIKTKECFNGDILNYLHYKSWKGVKGNNNCSSNFTYINDLSKKAIDTLINIPEYKQRRKEWNINNLYCGIENTKIEQTPISPELFSGHIKKLWRQLDIDNLLDTTNLDANYYSFLSFSKIRNHSKRNKYGELIKTVAYPTTQQFRFHVITELYEKGVPLAYIKRFMSHLTEDMTKYHILNTSNKVQEDLEAAKRVLSGIVTGNEKIIGEDHGLTDNIKRFIEANHFNVEKDLDAIVSKLAEDIPISVKTGGVCIKSSRFRPCSIDSRTDEMYCAYNVCPNIFHFFYHCGITWRKCKELKEVIDINQKRGFLKQVYKDTNNLRSIISHQLLPEMNELQVQLKAKGINTIYEKYPDLIDIIENFDEIKKEVTSWLQQTQQN